METHDGNGPGLGRRQFLGLGGLGLLSAAGVARSQTAGPAASAPSFTDDPFSLGVASGDPLPDGSVVWTRLAPKPLEPGGGMAGQRVSVLYEVATDERFRRRVRRGQVVAGPELGHSVHVELRGLEPGREYFYRFRAGGEISPVGRTRTAPEPGASSSRLRFAFASCQDYTDGYFTAYQYLADEDLDFAVHLGDYIYEVRQRGDVRRHAPDYEVESLDDYRIRYGQYKSEPELRAAHAAFPWIISMDDHDVENNWAGPYAQVEAGREDDPERFLLRRAAAFQAFYEHLPLRIGSRPAGPRLQVYRRLRYGRLAQLDVLDTRQFRANQVCGPAGEEPTREAPCDDRLDPSRSMLGAEQEQWLLDGLAASDARWNILANQVLMFQRDAQAGPGELFGMDHWDGYVAARDRLLGGIADRGVTNPVVLTGDAHISYVADLKSDFHEPSSSTIATEFAGTSVSSDGDGVDRSAFDEEVLAENPHLHFSNRQRGYVRCTVDAEQWRTDFRIMPYVTERDAPISTRASYVVEAGRPGAHPR